ncbi:hypothetical protein Nizo2259_1121 [Lactiplantibacillus plantarum]|uniref:Uncharacterized protein n=1 Tax=Lactiplantibacillus plantarum TaxID=1590 RepID=A0A162EP25_LACPN|nr:hypothetical protein FBR6_2409 [Lactiplantibacillus plantarum]KZT97213.1 hypothetical protein Nizo2259_1121 [Lactiplantibacillus plantarum]KZU13258.1 hypothetical protein Nizo2264_1902 [Lactiplantibacillus plantarum]KZU21569.1 hypothetical protein Nizo2484_1243 [Lactiplantibacillus plantarum]KZU25974.1 hypothetical protein Nizo2485_1556 [Lactiplantibacillus plantarum]
MRSLKKPSMILGKRRNSVAYINDYRYRTMQGTVSLLIMLVVEN